MRERVGRANRNGRPVAGGFSDDGLDGDGGCVSAQVRGRPSANPQHVSLAATTARFFASAFRRAVVLLVQPDNRARSWAAGGHLGDPRGADCRGAAPARNRATRGDRPPATACRFGTAPEYPPRAAI